MKRALIAVFVLIGLVGGARAQDPSSTSSSSSAPERSVSWPKLIPNIGSDQKQIWTFPARLGHDYNWVPFVGILAVTAGLVASDPSTIKPFMNTTAFHGFNSVFSGTGTSIGMVVVPVSMYAIGLWRKDTYAQHTALLVGEAVADSEILATVIKTANRRSRPSGVGPGDNAADTWFESPGGVALGRGGFPSGHAIAAFSVATVIARRYGKQHRWVPYVSYGLATLVGLSRVTTLAHFPSDVFLGGALGYSVSRFAVLR
jgi:membrane-associated phospholipid phosphatase